MTHGMAQFSKKTNPLQCGTRLHRKRTTVLELFPWPWQGLFYQSFYHSFPVTHTGPIQIFLASWANKNKQKESPMSVHQRTPDHAINGCKMSLSSSLLEWASGKGENRTALTTISWGYFLLIAVSVVTHFPNALLYSSASTFKKKDVGFGDIPVTSGRLTRQQLRSQLVCIYSSESPQEARASTRSPKKNKSAKVI